eukprot:scaffold12491_cov24-Tisochrysis_lutea.AAC.1
MKAIARRPRNGTKLVVVLEQLVVVVVATRSTISLLNLCALDDGANAKRKVDAPNRGAIYHLLPQSHAHLPQMSAFISASGIGVPIAVSPHRSGTIVGLTARLTAGKLPPPP